MAEKQLINVRKIASILNVPVSWVYQRTRLARRQFPIWNWEGICVLIQMRLLISLKSRMFLKIMAIRI